MKSLFPSYYPVQEDEFQQLFNGCIFTFDANTLLNLYRYTKETREEFIHILTSLSDYIWLTNQAAFEYQENRLEVLAEQANSYQKTINELNNIKIILNTALNEYHERYSFIDIDKIKDELQSLVKEIESKISVIQDQLKEKKKEHPNWFVSDPIRELLDKLFKDKVGKAYAYGYLDKLYQQAERRYIRLQPPGYKDLAKPGIRKYGDFIMWCQIMDFAKKTQKSIILITNDQKSDWWDTEQGKRSKPHRLLIQEIFAKAEVQFFIFTQSEFMDYAQNQLHISSTPKAKEEVATIEEQELEHQNAEESLAAVQDYQAGLRLREAGAINDLAYNFDAGGLSRIAKSLQEAGMINRSNLALSGFNNLAKTLAEAGALNQPPFDAGGLSRIAKSLQETTFVPQSTSLNQKNTLLTNPLSENDSSTIINAHDNDLDEANEINNDN